jgi:hypothetical protein
MSCVKNSWTVVVLHAPEFWYVPETKKWARIDDTDYNSALRSWQWCKTKARAMRVACGLDNRLPPAAKIVLSHYKRRKGKFRVKEFTYEREVK